MSTATMTAPEVIDRKQNDSGPAAAIYADLADGAGDPIIAGPVRLRIGTFGPPPRPLVTVTMTHVGNGTWEWIPALGDLIPGVWKLETFVGDVSPPADGYGKLVVRRTVPEVTP